MFGAMPLTRAQALFYLDMIKARSLVMLDDKRAHSPFPYDKRFFDKLRPDQVPRFLRCITDPQKLPLRYFKLSELSALQNRVDIDKVESIRMARHSLKAPVVVKIREDRGWTIADGLHRTTADWLDYEDYVEFHYADLSEKEQAVEPVAGAGKFNTARDHADFKTVDMSEAE